MAAFDGGILQFLQLTVWSYLALVFYVLFEVCLLASYIESVAGLNSSIERGYALSPAQYPPHS
jgi:hypothetical protein